MIVLTVTYTADDCEANVSVVGVDSLGGDPCGCGAGLMVWYSVIYILLLRRSSEAQQMNRNRKGYWGPQGTQQQLAIIISKNIFSCNK